MKGEMINSTGGLLVSSGTKNSVAVTKDHKVFVWGFVKKCLFWIFNSRSDFGALGQWCNSTTGRCYPSKTNVPILLEGALKGQEFKQIESGEYFTLALTTDGKVSIYL